MFDADTSHRTRQSTPKSRRQAYSWATLLGMPHLAVAGLSETWFLKEAGHVHWQLLEEAVGCRSRHWKDVSSARLYASFIAYRIEGRLAALVGEGDLLDCHSELAATSRNRFCSRHVLRSASLPFETTLTMITTFVRRDGDSNCGFVRTSFGSSELVDDGFGLIVDELLGTRRQFRRDAVQVRESATCVSQFAACPMEDFNHAGMVYFATFPRYLDRAERGLQPVSPTPLALPPLVSRSCFYFGNADAGDEIEAAAVYRGDVVMSQIWSGGSLLCAAETLRRPL
ncbi:MAG: hypothetical protein H7306_02355 [Bacteriovorax sp.]|nr:hypothetical protein [Rhizobacter sp.]